MDAEERITAGHGYAIGLYGCAIAARTFAGARRQQSGVRHRDVTDVSALFVADPFMIRRDEFWYLFFEVYN